MDAGLSAVTGLLAGVLVGYCLQRGGLCFHAATRTALRGDRRLISGWLLAVAVASVGLAVLYLLPFADDLNRGLALRPVENIVGGVVIGVGMVVARSCVSGLFFKLGAGMLGAGVGLLGWAIGELLARRIDLGGPTVLGGGDDATVAGVLGVPRLLVALLLAAAAYTLARRQRATDGGWTPVRLGVALGAAIVAAWVLAGLGDSRFGPSSVGAVASVADGNANVWLIAFLAGLIVGGGVAARTSGAFHVRGETPVRYGQLFAGGLLLGAGGWIAGGCNLGHGLSGAAQLNVSSFLVVAAMILGVALAGSVATGLTSGRRPAGEPIR